MRNTVKVIAVGLVLSPLGVIPTAMSQPVTKDDLQRLEDRLLNKIDEAYRRQTEKLSKQDERLNRVENIISSMTGENGNHTPPAPPAQKRVIHVHRHYYYCCCPPWWW